MCPPQWWALSGKTLLGPPFQPCARFGLFDDIDLSVLSFSAMFVVVIRRIRGSDFLVFGMWFIVQIQHYPFMLFNTVIPGQSIAMSPVSAFKPAISADARIIVNLSGRVVVIRFMFAAPAVRGRPGRRTVPV